LRGCRDDAATSFQFAVTVVSNIVWFLRVANFCLPTEGTVFDKVEFTELDGDEVKKLVEQYNKEGHAALPPPEKRFRGSREYTSRFSGQSSPVCLV